MKRFGFNPLLLGLLAFLAIRSGVSAETNGLPHFQEVFRLLRANLPGVSEEDLNRAAVQGLLDQFYPRAILVTNGAPAAAGQEDVLLTRTTVYDESYGYVRVARVATGLADQIKSAYEKLGGRNKLKGLVLDLRFAAGQDYTAAANAADQFLTKEQPLRIHKISRRFPNPSKRNLNRTPALRETDAAVLIGTRTAGQAQIFKEFDLSNGQRLRIATGQVRVGKGQALSATGVSPDLEITVSGEDEKAYFADAFKVLPYAVAPSRVTRSVAQTGSTNRVSRRRLNEAELVRMQREGLNPEDQDATAAAPGRETDPAGPVVRDPALARALDLLKGIAIVERSLAR